MENGLRLEKSTGYTQSTTTENESVSAQQKSTASKKESPVLTDVPTREESSNSAVEVSASNILAILVMMGDFKELKNQLPESRVTSSNGKIYWCAELPGHLLAIEKGKLLVDGKPVDSIIGKLLVEE
jgi:hypothetical protein